MSMDETEDSVSMMTMETKEFVASTKPSTSPPRSTSSSTGKTFSFSPQQQGPPTLPVDASSCVDEVKTMSVSGRSFFGRKKGVGSSSRQVPNDQDSTLYNNENSDIEETGSQIKKKKKKQSFLKRVIKKSGSTASTANSSSVGGDQTKVKRYHSLDKSFSKKQINLLANEADKYDKSGVQKYNAKKYKEAVTCFTEAYERKKRVFGEHSLKVAYAVEKLAKAEDMLVMTWKQDSTKSDADQNSLDGSNVSNNQVTHRYNACTHYRDARYIFETHGVDNLRILTDMGNYFFREGMDDEALECFDTLTKAPRKYTDQEVVEVSRAYFQMGEIYRASDQHLDAIVCYENALYLQKDVFGDIHDANTILLYHSALSHIEIGEQTWTANDKGKAKESFVIALDYLKKALEINKARSDNSDSDVDIVDLLRLFSQANARLDNDVGALEANSKIIDLLKNSDKPAASEQLIASLRHKADLMEKKGDLESAVDCLDEAIQILSTSNTAGYRSHQYEIYEQLALLGLKKGDTKGVISSYLEMIEIAKEQDRSLDLIGRIYSRLGKCYANEDDFKLSIEYYNEAKKCFVRRFGSEDAKVGIVLHHLGNLYFEIGNWSECKRCYEQAMTILKANKGLEYEYYQTMLNNMGYFACSIGDHDKATELYKQALDLVSSNTDDVDSSSCLAFQNNYANVLLQKGDLEEAVNIYEQALSEKVSVLGNGDLRITGLLYNLGNVYLKMGNTNKALENYEKARAIRTKVLGREHEEVLTVYSQIGNVYCSMGKYKTAHQIFRYILKNRHENLGIFNENTLHSMTNQAFVLYKLGHLDLALCLYQEVLNKTDEDWDLQGSVYHSMGNVYTKKREFNNAIKVYTESMNLKRKLFKYEHRSVARSLHNMGMVYCNQKKYDEAEISLNEALFINKKVLKSHHPDIGKAMLDLGRVHMKKSEYAKAKQYFTDAKQLFLVANLPESHVFVKSVDSNLVFIEKKLKMKMNSIIETAQ